MRVIVAGRVQGVGYRAWTVRQARSLALTGWVRNRPDGTVEAVFAGGQEAVNLMLAACRMGPGHAVVKQVETQAIAEEGWPDFRVRPAAE